MTALDLAALAAQYPPATFVVTPPPLPEPRTPVAAPAAPVADVSAAVQATRSPLRRHGAVGFTVAISGELSFECVGTGIVGRGPSADGGHRHVIALDDPEKILSREHLEFGATADGQFWVADLHSGNGTYLLSADRHQVRLPPDRRTPVPPGATVQFGSRTLTVALRG